MIAKREDSATTQLENSDAGERYLLFYDDVNKLGRDATRKSQPWGRGGETHARQVRQGAMREVHPENTVK